MSTADKNLSPDSAGATLSRKLGVAEIVFMVVAAAAPLGVTVAAFPIVISVGGSTAGPWLFVIAGLLLTIFAVGFTLMSRYVPNAGAFYSYIQAGFGRVAGTGAAILALVSYYLLLVGCTAYFGSNMGLMIDHFTGVSIPWYVWMLGGFALTGYLGYLNIDVSAKVLGIALVLETLVVVVLDVAILGQGGADGITAAPWALSELSDGAPGLGLMFCFFAFFGFEATAVFRNEAKDPVRTIPRATYIAVIFIGTLYALSMWCVLVGVGTDKAVEVASTNSTFVLDLAGEYVSPLMQDVMFILLITSMFAVVLSFHNVITRYLYTMGVKGVLPRSLGQVSAKHRTPSNASVALTIACLAATVLTIVLGLDPVLETYTWLAGAATLGIIVMMVMTGCAVILYFRRNSVEHSVWQTVIAPAVSVVGLLVVLYLVLDNFSLLVGGKKAVEITLLATVILAFVGGAVVALRMRQRDPEKYAQLMDEKEEEPTPA